MRVRITCVIHEPWRTQTTETESKLARLMEQARKRGLDAAAAREWALDYTRQSNEAGDEYDIEVPDLAEFAAAYEP